MPQLVTRVDEQLADAVDALVREGIVASRSEAVRVSLGEFIHRAERRAIGARIVAGYRARPQTDHEFTWTDTQATRMITEEPW